MSHIWCVYSAGQKNFVGSFFWSCHLLFRTLLPAQKYPGVVLGWLCLVHFSRHCEESTRWWVPSIPPHGTHAGDRRRRAPRADETVLGRERWSEAGLPRNQENYEQDHDQQWNVSLMKTNDSNVFMVIQVLTFNGDSAVLHKNRKIIRLITDSLFPPPNYTKKTFYLYYWTWLGLCK